MKRLFVFAILVLAVTQGVFAKESERHQERPAPVTIRDIR